MMDITSILWYMALVGVISSYQHCWTHPNGLSMDCIIGNTPAIIKSDSHENQIKEIKIMASFTSLKANTFQLPSLTHISITNSALKTMEPSAFNNLPTLKSLELKRNYISTITKGVFNNLTNLVHLDLSHNNIRLIEHNSFTGVKIKQLSLRFNKIESMSPVVENCEHYEDLNLLSNNINIISSLRNCKRLRVLNLGYNNIAQLQNKLFPRSLTSLDLTHNHIESVEAETFAEMSRLKYLTLARNNLYKLSGGSIPIGLFQPLTGLIDLDLSYNGLAQLLPGTFSKLASLTSLNLGFNYLNKLSNGLLNDLPLTQLSIRRNLFTNLEDNFFNDAYDITINLADNPWSCDYLSYKIDEIIRVNPENKIINANSIKCINTKIIENDVILNRTPNNQASVVDIPNDLSHPVEDLEVHQEESKQQFLNSNNKPEENTKQLQRISALDERTIQTEKTQFLLVAILVALIAMTGVISTVFAFVLYKSKRNAQIKSLQGSLLDTY